MSNTEEFVPAETIYPDETLFELKKSKKKITAFRVALAVTTAAAIGALIYFKATENDDESDEEGWTIVPTPVEDTVTDNEE